MLAGMMPAAALAETSDPAQQETAQTEQGTAPSSGTDGDPNASPSPSQEPTPAPTEESDAVPTPTPEVEPSPSPSGEPTPDPSPEPSQTPAAPQSPAKAPSQPASSSSPVTLEEGDVNTHIATYVNTVPAGITWVEGVTEATFDTAWETVTASAADGTEYTVEVVPEGAVYFVDSYCGNMTDVGSTEPFDAIHTLADSTLLNDRYDQFKTQDTTWGLLETDARTKSANGNEASKDYTGIYGADATGATLTYQFALEAGSYTVTSFHREWWSVGPDKDDRAIEVQLTDTDGTVLGTTSKTFTAIDQGFTSTIDFTLTEAQTVTLTTKSTTNQAPAISWIGIAPAVEEDPVAPSLSGQLEETGGLTITPDSALTDTDNMGKVFTHATQWNNQGQYGATFNDPSVFHSAAFTVLFDVLPTSPSGDTSVLTKRAALTIGTVANKVRVPTWDSQIGYGADTSDGGMCANYAPVTGYKQNEWNSVAVVYHEDDGANGALEVYIDGKLAGQVADLGFKFSEMDGISAILSRSLNTNYLQEGSYDNIVVGNYAMTAEDAKAETARRAEAKASLPADTAALAEAVAEAEALLEEGGVTATERLNAALEAARTLLDGNPTLKQQEEVDAATVELKTAISEVNPTEIVLTKEAVEQAAQNENGLTWKGWGMLNGNSTSNLLLDYKAENPAAYNEMMQYLFGSEHPLFTHIKMEMGNDGNNSTGAEACTMRYEDEEADASRSPGFVMAADAKAINPDVKISILRWGMPTWVQQKWDSDRTGAGYEAMYKWYKETIFDAYEKYGYVVDFVNPDTNETSNPDEDFIKWFANRVATETEFPDYFTEEAKQAYNNIRIIASDENKGLQIVPSMRADEDLYNAVDIIGFHYRTNATEDYVAMADVDDKEVWYSEGCATFGYSELQENKNAQYGADTIGGYQSPLALADSIPNAFMASRRSHYIFQPAIGSFYEGIQYAHKELLSARDPWSGYIHYDPALQMIAHFSRFAVTGWEDNDPSQNEIWRMIASASHASFGGSDNEHATAGIDGDASYLTLADPNGKDFSVVFVNNTRNQKTFHINVEDLPEAAAKTLQTWVTQTDSYMKKGASVTPAADGWTVVVPAYSVVTATTLDEYSEEELAMPQDGIRTGDRTVLDTDSTGKTADAGDEYLYADNFEYAEEAEGYLASRGDEPRYMLDSHGAWEVQDGRLVQELNASVSQWNGGEPVTIVGDFRWMNYNASIDVQIPEANSAVWAGLGVRSQSGMNWNQDGYTLRIYGDGKWEFYRAGSVMGSGSVAADPTGSYSLQVAANGSSITAFIDGEAVFTYADANPMDAGRIKISAPWNKVYFDNLAVTTIPGTIPYATSMVDGQDDSVAYTGSWNIPGPGGGSADDWYRTTSTNTAAGAGFTFTFPVEGTGFAIVGANGGGAELTVQVDDQEPVTATTASSSRRYETYTLTGLEYAKHTVTVTVNSGTLAIDALYTLGEALPAGEDILVSIETELPEVMGTTVGVEPSANLPAKVNVKTGSGEIVEKDIVWENSGDFTQAFGTGSVTGTVQGGETAIGVPLSITIPVEIVPADVVYFIDAAAGDPAELETTPPYEGVRNAVGGSLLNAVYDQLKTDDNTWGRVEGQESGGAGSGVTDKNESGIYANPDQRGVELSYSLYLEPGTYTITSAHSEWWSNQNRSMDLTLTTTDGEVSAGSIAGTNATADVRTNSYTFTISEAQNVVYTITSTGSHAPVLSWLAVQKKTAEGSKSELAALVSQIRAQVAAAQEAGVRYAEEPLEAWQYTGSGATVGRDSLADLEEVCARAETLAAAPDTTMEQADACKEELLSVYGSLRTLPGTYTSIPGTTGEVILADTGLPMQAHGGSVLTMVESAADGKDIDGDGQVTEGKTVYLWYGEDKTNDTHPVDGVRCYVSTDLYNWSDRGLVLYTQDSVLPIEEGTEQAVTSNPGADGEGTTQDYNVMQRSEKNLAYIKSIGTMATAPEGMSESEFIEIKNFLRAYVTEFAVEPTSDHDVNWVAAAYDETPITASSFLYPDSKDESVSTQQTTPLQLAFEGLYGGYCITERPKVIYNDSTDQYVMVFHADGVLYNNADLNSWVAGGCQGNCSASRYSRAMVGFATSDTPFGPFKLVNMTRMNYDLEYSEDRLGEARDMTVFVDKGVDRNGDGVDDAYVIYSSEMNAKLYVSLLNAGYTGPIAQGDDAVAGEDYAARILSDNSREAPAMFKYDGWYYLITSGTDGWNSTEHIYYRSRDIFSGWEQVGNPALNDTGKCFNTQVTYVIPIDAENGKFIYMADRWNGNDLSDSRTVWLPIRMNVDNTLSILNESNWTIERLDQISPTRIVSEMPALVYPDGSNLPDVVTVMWQGHEVTSRVESWSEIGQMGVDTLTAVLTDCVDAEGNPAQAQVAVVVAPENLLYFANPVKGDVSADYTAVMEASAATLLQDPAVNDGAYSAENGFGYVGEGYNVRENNADIYQSLRYGANKDSAISYQFDLEANGEYEVYIGMFDPSGWANYNTGRRADIVLNGITVEEGYSYYSNCNNTPDTLHYTATADATGKLLVDIKPNASTDSAIQVSFIMVAGKPNQYFTVRFESNGGTPIASQYIAAGQNAAEPEKPQKDLYAFTGWYTDEALTQKFDFAAAITADITLYAGWEQSLALDVDDLTEVPEEVRDRYETLEELKEAMLVQAEAVLQTKADGVDYYEVKLFIADPETGLPMRDENGDPIEVTEENFPAEGVRVPFEYPTDAETGEKITGTEHMFTIVHMLKNGNLEVFRDSDILYTETGMTITVRSLSPFAVAYRTRPAQEPSEPDAGGSGNGSSNNGTQTSGNGQQTAAGGSTAEGGSASAVVPQTSDPLPLEALVVVALLAAAAIVVLLIVRRKNNGKGKNE